MLNQDQFLSSSKNIYKGEISKDELEISFSQFQNAEEAMNELLKKRLYVQKFYEKQFNPYMQSIDFKLCQKGVDLEGKLFVINSLNHFFLQVILDNNQEMSPCLTNAPAFFARFDYFIFKNKIVIFKYKSKIPEHILDLKPIDQYMNYLKSLEF
jgi:hypothetical protein